jgi:hypothetical protein
MYFKALEVDMKDKLLASAQKLIPPPEKAREEFSAKIDMLVATGNKNIAARLDLDKLIGAENQEMAVNNNSNFARFMDAMFVEYDPATLVETVLWVFRAYRSHGFLTTYWPANLDIWLKMLEKELSDESFRAIAPFYNWLIVNIQIFVKLTDESLSEKIPCGTKDQEVNS